MNKNDIIAAVLTVVILALAGGFTVWFKSTRCGHQAVSFEEHHWGIVSGCMVKHNGRWIPLDNIRGFDEG